MMTVSICITYFLLKAAKRVLFLLGLLVDITDDSGIRAGTNDIVDACITLNPLTSVLELDINISVIVVAQEDEQQPLTTRAMGRSITSC